MFPLNLYARVHFVFYKSHMRPRVQRAPGLPCALSWEGGKFLANLGRNASRDRETVSARNDESEYSNNINIIDPKLTLQCSPHQHSMALWLRMAYRVPISFKSFGSWDPRILQPAASSVWFAALSGVSGAMRPLRF